MGCNISQTISTYTYKLSDISENISSGMWYFEHCEAFNECSSDRYFNKYHNCSGYKLNNDCIVKHSLDTQNLIKLQIVSLLEKHGYLNNFSCKKANIHIYLSNEDLFIKIK